MRPDQLTAATPAEAVYTDFSGDMDSQGVVHEIAAGPLAEVLAQALAWPVEAHARIHVNVGEIETVEAYGIVHQRLRPSLPLTELAALDLGQAEERT